MINYAIDRAARRVTLSYDAYSTAEEWLATLQAALADPAYEPGLDFLVDRRVARAPDPHYIDTVVAFFESHKRELAGGRWAVVVGSEAGYGMARMATQRLVDRGVPPIEIFRDIAEARAWLAGGVGRT